MLLTSLSNEQLLLSSHARRNVSAKDQAICLMETAAFSPQSSNAIANLIAAIATVKTTLTRSGSGCCPAPALDTEP